MFITKLLFLLATTSVVVNMARTSTHTSTFTKSSPKKGSPKKKDMTLIKLNKSKPMHHPNYVFKVVKLKADIEVIWCKRAPCDDAFIHPLIKDIGENDAFHDHRIIGITHCHASCLDNTLLFNDIDGYPCCLIVHVVDESTHRTCTMIFLMVLHQFMMRPENNRYLYEYLVNKISDLTPADEEKLEPINALIPNYLIINIIMAMFETANEHWYQNNMEIMNDYFADQLYPHSAIDQLGFPETHGAFQPGFNPPRDM